MNKLNMQTTNIVDENIKRIGELFPNCLTERLNDEGKPEVAIDFDQLRQELSKDIVEGPEERYQFTWPDKRNAIRLANAPTTDTLRPCREESVDFDNTQNLYIEGDNLQVLKLLRENYLGKVKMIYIDPPYNTGNDFVYNDDFSQSAGEYMHNSGQEDEEGNRLVVNAESNGRFHTDWLNMIYPRLKVAKDLLSDDGVILISIDDNEVDNLRKICDEVFGATNFISSFIWNTDGHTDNQFIIKTNHEYVLVYCKLINSVDIGWVIDPNTRQESNLWKGFAENSITKNGPKNPPLYVTLKKGFPCKAASLDLESNNPSKGFWDEVNSLGYISRQITTKYNVSYPIRMDKVIVRDNILQEDVRMFSGFGNPDKLKIFNNNNFSPIEEADGKCSFYLSENGVIYYYKQRDKARNIVSVLRGFGTTEQMRSSLESQNIYFSYPKPLDLLKYLIQVGTTGASDIVLDFFSGSATTAEAVMKLNTEKNISLKFIMVQIPEETDQTTLAYQAGYKNICEIGKERIRRAGKKIKEESPLTTQDLDTGFRVLKLDSSNMQDVYYTPADFNERDLFEDNIKPDRTEEDLLFQTMIELGIELSAKIEKRSIAGKTVWSVSDGYLMACFDEEVNETAITEIARQHPYYFVMRDSSLANDQVADNFEQIWEEYSKDTVRRIL